MQNPHKKVAHAFEKLCMAEPAQCKLTWSFLHRYCNSYWYYFCYHVLQRFCDIYLSSCVIWSPATIYYHASQWSCDRYWSSDIIFAIMPRRNAVTDIDHQISFLLSCLAEMLWHILIIRYHGCYHASQRCCDTYWSSDIIFAIMPRRDAVTHIDHQISFLLSRLAEMLWQILIIRYHFCYHASQRCCDRYWSSDVIFTIMPRGDAVTHIDHQISWLLSCLAEMLWHILIIRYHFWYHVLYRLCDRCLSSNFVVTIMFWRECILHCEVFWQHVYW